METEEINTKQADNKMAVINGWFKIIIISVITSVVLYKIVITPIDLSGFNFSDLMSLILAIFAIALSVLFYVKANDTSNQFYDNTYHFTKDMSVILGRIEAGFGERLRHLDEGYSGLVDKFDKFPTEKVKTEIKIEKSEKEIEKVAKEKEEIIENLLQKTQLQREEKEEISRRLSEKDAELDRTKEELSILRSKQKLARSFSNRYRQEEEISSIREFGDFFYQKIFSKLNIEEARTSPTLLRQQIKRIKNQISPRWINTAKAIGWFDKNGVLTLEGIKGISDLIEKYSQ